MAAGLLLNPNNALTRHPWPPHQSSWRRPDAGPQQKVTGAFRCLNSSNCRINLKFPTTTATRVFPTKLPAKTMMLPHISYFVTSERMLASSGSRSALCNEVSVFALSCDDDGHDQLNWTKREEEDSGNMMAASSSNDDHNHKSSWRNLKDSGKRLAAVAADAISKVFESLLPKAAALGGALVMAALLLLASSSNLDSVALAASPSGDMRATAFSSQSSSSLSSSCGGTSPSPSLSPDADSQPYSSSVSLKMSSSPKPTDGVWEGLLIVVFCSFLLEIVRLRFFLEPPCLKPAVAKVQIGILGPGHRTRMELNRIAEGAVTSPPGRSIYVLKETTSALLRLSDHWISGYASVDRKESMGGVAKRFKQLSLEEKVKFDGETNVSQSKAQSTSSGGDSRLYTVVTILLAREGLPRLEPINGRIELRHALEKLAFIRTTKPLVIEVLWTPLVENHILTEAEYLQKYPSLRPLYRHQT